MGGVEGSYIELGDRDVAKNKNHKTVIHGGIYAGSNDKLTAHPSLNPPLATRSKFYPHSQGDDNSTTDHVGGGDGGILQSTDIDIEEEVMVVGDTPLKKR